MKKMLIYVLALLVMLNALPAFAETVAPDIQYDYDELVVGTITPFNGSFYGGMWGNIASDLDVRALIHGYNLVTWGEDDRFEVDPSVVSGFAVKENAQGDRVYSIALCDDLYYSNGEKITARDYAFTLLLSCAPEIGKLGGSARTLDFLAGYVASLASAPACDRGQKAAKVQAFAERLFDEGGPAVDQVTKLFGDRTAKRLILRHMYGVRVPE